MSKPCKKCGSTNHTVTWCFQTQKKPILVKKRLKQIGKKGAAWITARHEWIKNNPPNHQGYWECYLKISPNCIPWIDIDQLTLDHVVARSKDSTKLTDQTNLAPACYPCNEMKASKDLEELRV